MKRVILRRGGVVGMIDIIQLPQKLHIKRCRGCELFAR